MFDELVKSVLRPGLYVELVTALRIFRGTITEIGPDYIIMLTSKTKLTAIQTGALELHAMTIRRRKA